MDTMASFICSLPPKASTLITVLISIILIDDLTSDQQNVLGNILMLIGQTISTNATTQNYCESLKNDQEQKQLKDDVDELKKQMEELKKQD